MWSETLKSNACRNEMKKNDGTAWFARAEKVGWSGGSGGSGGEGRGGEACKRGNCRIPRIEPRISRNHDTTIQTGGTLGHVDIAKYHIHNLTRLRGGGRRGGEMSTKRTILVSLGDEIPDED